MNLIRAKVKLSPVFGNPYITLRIPGQAQPLTVLLERANPALPVSIPAPTRRPRRR